MREILPRPIREDLRERSSRGDGYYNLRSNLLAADSHPSPSPDFIRRATFRLRGAPLLLLPSRRMDPLPE